MPTYTIPHANDLLEQVTKDLLAEKGIHGSYVRTPYTFPVPVTESKLLFTDAKDQFLYNLHGGDTFFQQETQDRVNYCITHQLQVQQIWYQQRRIQELENNEPQDYDNEE